MDPLTAALNLATVIITGINNVWASTSPALKTAEADNVAKIFISIGNFFVSVQEKINASIH